MCRITGPHSPTQKAEGIGCPSPDPQRKTRLKLWELPGKMHCPIVGTCLNVDELRKLARKARYTFNTPASDYDVHVGFVAAAEEKGLLSLTAQKALDKKFAGHIKRASRCKSNAELASFWKEALESGGVPGAFWAIVTHPRCDAVLRTQVYGEVHMLSHQIGAGQRADLVRLTETQAELAQLRRQFDGLHDRSHRQLEDRDHQILDLQACLTKCESERRRLASKVEQLERQLAAMRAGMTHEYVTRIEQENYRLQQERHAADEERERLREDFRVSIEKVAKLESEQSDLAAERAALERVLTQIYWACDDCEQNACADRLDLGGRRILCVGGQKKVIDQYKAMVLRCNGSFEHHDGGLEDRRQRLECMLASADAVVCATDCVSHDAYHRLKRFCKRHHKKHAFMRTSGISTFVRAIESVAG